MYNIPALLALCIREDIIFVDPVPVCVGYATTMYNILVLHALCICEDIIFVDLQSNLSLEGRKPDRCRLEPGKIANSAWGQGGGAVNSLDYT